VCRLDPAHPFPYLPSGSINIAVELRDPSDSRYECRGMCAIVNIPSSLPKWIEVPSDFDGTCAPHPSSAPLLLFLFAGFCVLALDGRVRTNQSASCTLYTLSGSNKRWWQTWQPCVSAYPAAHESANSLRRGVAAWEHGFVPLEKIIVQNLDCLFAGMFIESAHSFRVTRNAELDRQEDEAEDLLDMIADEVRERRFAPFVRLEVEADMPPDLTEFLVHELALKMEQDVYRVPQVLDLEHLAKVVRCAPLCLLGVAADVLPKLAAALLQREVGMLCAAWRSS
jgi:polyphosphate kinase